jgi:hypothetical protein
MSSINILIGFVACVILFGALMLRIDSQEKNKQKSVN